MTASRGHHKISHSFSRYALHTGSGQLYLYTSDLMLLDFCRPQHDHAVPQFMQVSTPLKVAAWETILAAHPDRAYARYICEGLSLGFRVGFQRDSIQLKPAAANMASTRLHPDTIRKYLADELSRGHMLGPLPLTWKPLVHINRFGLIPKGHNTGKFRLITDLSYPHGQSVNDGIDSDLCSLSYSCVDDVAEIAARLGQGALLAKVDIESAYRLIPVHPQDRILQAMEWEGNVYVDPMLPFGLRSAPKIFNAVADALNWHLLQAGIRYLLHYLDDFIIIGSPDSMECQAALAVLDHSCQLLGVPIAEHKRDGPTTCLTYLGIIIDTSAGELRLPADKLQRLENWLRKWGDKKTCSRRELESLIGLLNHACKVVRPGRSFLRRMLDLLHSTKARPGSNSIIRLNLGCRADMAWWKEFVSTWNGVSFLYPPQHLPHIEMTSDASGGWGCGAWCGNRWFQVQWDDRSCDLSIACKELIPILLACAAWGHEWQGHRVTCHCDNQVVVAGLRSRSSKDKSVMHLLRCLVFIEAHFNCYLSPEYIGTSQNDLADDLSRNRLSSFLSKVPEACHQPTLTSNRLLDLLLNPQEDWVLPAWRQQFRGIFTRV